MRILLIASIMMVLPIYADASANRTEQRAAYKEALSALNRGRITDFNRIRKGLSDYPLYPYLEYNRLSKNVANLPARDVSGFRDSWPDSPLVDRLELSWLHMLGLKGKWSELESHYDERHRNTEVRCLYERARLKGKDKEAALKATESLWLVGRSQPKACDPLFKAWTDAGRLTPELAWKRLTLALKSGNPGLARYLLRFLEPAQRKLAERFILTHRKPETLGKYADFKADTAENRQIVLHGIRRQKRRDSEKAALFWSHYRDRLSFTAEEHRQLDSQIALSLASGYRKGVQKWMGLADPAEENVKLLSWRLRVALAERDWTAVSHWSDRLMLAEPKQPDWTYWKARSVLELRSSRAGRKQANALLEKIAPRRHFYGFLAADRLGKPYGYQEQAAQITPEQLSAVEGMPGIQRALELYAIGQESQARVEWNHATRSIDTEKLIAAAHVAKGQAWHNQAIVSSIGAGHWDDLKLRFPMGWQDLFIRESKRNNIDSYWSLALARQESALRPTAVSRANAMGLMQLLPSTAKRVARQKGVKYRRRSDLLKPEVNIRLGTSYMASMHRKFGNMAYASAAYNAGPHRVERWLKERPNLDLDAWIETIPFSETRQYVKNVLAFRLIYAHLEGRKLSGTLSP